LAFVDTWNYIQKNLNKGTVIENWTKLKNHTGVDFAINDVFNDKIDINPPQAKTIQHVQKNDFENVYNISMSANDGWHLFCR